VTSTSSETVRCAACGKESSAEVLHSASEFFPRDLDGRPGEMYRSTISCWINECPHCGLCAPKLEKVPPEVVRLVASTGYREILGSQAPVLARRFLCFAQVADSLSDPLAAFEAVLHASWICDDNEISDMASRYRLAAVARLMKLKPRKSAEASATEWDEVVMADLLRRAGEFGRALEICDSQDVAAEPIRLRLLDFERRRAAARDTRRYTTVDALTQVVGIGEYLEQLMSRVRERLGPAFHLEFQRMHAETLVRISAQDFEPALLRLFEWTRGVLPGGANVQLRLSRGGWIILDIGFDGSVEQRATWPRPLLDGVPTDALSWAAGMHGGFTETRAFPDGSAVFRIRFTAVEAELSQ
jgi:hypothetical protein